MPYISTEVKMQVDKFLDDVRLEDHLHMSPGTLNYLVTQLCLAYLRSASHKNYAQMNDIIGALECAKQEFYRRMIVPYEEDKKDENGDVYPS